MPTRFARPSTCCCGRFRSGPAPMLCSSGSRLRGGPVCSITSRSAPVPASMPSSPTTIRSWSTGSPPSSAVTRTPWSSELRQKMFAASERQEYELAARLRDRLRDVERANERQEVVTDKKEDFDLLATFGDDLETSVQVLHVRRGRLVGRLGTIVDRVEDVTEPRAGRKPPPRGLRRPGASPRGAGAVPARRTGGLGGMADGATGRQGDVCASRSGGPSGG